MREPSKSATRSASAICTGRAGHGYDQRVIDYVKDIAEYVQTRDGRISASQMLERFLFAPDMQYTPISKLPEAKTEITLSVLVSGATVLILDEPSNNVDIPTHSARFPEHVRRWHRHHRFPRPLFPG